MNKTVIALVAGVVLGVVGSWVISTASEGEATPAAEAAVSLPDLPEPYYKVLFENEAVRIVDHQLGTGETEPEHTHAPMVAYFVEGATVVITEANDSTWEATIPTGAFLGDSLYWWTHALENTGDTPLHSILVEFKGYPTEN